MVTKHFCDVCGKEIKDLFYIAVDINHITEFEIFETCKFCATKFKKILQEFKDGTR